MITIHVTCPHFQQPEHVTKHGVPEAEIIRPKSNKVTPEKEAAILRLLEGRITIRGICRAVKCGPQPSMLPLKKWNRSKRWGDSIECDEIWAFVGSKKNPQWIWLGHFVEALSGLNFQITFARGVGWAATGRVT